ncbi:YybH family protein [Sciscionella marina]|uniref:YybH family protein n=1 Tax=Sciscionella marina TaxID=508770 RepID=UPI00038191B1|nr:SgcJ/EcaC family oxidoreductase [Sciscionella marina]
MTPPLPNPPETAAAQQADLTSIRAIVTDLETALNTADTELMSTHFAANAIVIEATGTVLSGRAALRERYQRGFAAELRGMHARYTLTEPIFVRPDVALVYQRAHAVDAAGEPLELDHTMITSYVLVNEEGRWWIRARQDTLAST